MFWADPFTSNCVYEMGTFPGNLKWTLTLKNLRHAWWYTFRVENPVHKKAMNSIFRWFPILKPKIWLEINLTNHWLLPKNALLNLKLPTVWLSSTGVEPPLFQNKVTFFWKVKILLFGKQNGKINCSEPWTNKSW